MSGLVRAAFVVAAGVLLTACSGGSGTGATGGGSSSTTSAPTGSTGPTTTAASTQPGTSPAVITAATKGVTTVKPGAIVAVDLVSTAYNRQGAIVPWAVPTSSDPAVLAPAPAGSFAGPNCPVDASCDYFVAHGVGEATLRAGGPSGIICDKSGAHCVGVTAVLGSWVVKVTAS
jgi:hypothetical protein